MKEKGPIPAGTEITFTYGKNYFGICNPTDMAPWMLQHEEDKDTSALEKEIPEKIKAHTWEDSSKKSAKIRKGKNAKAPRIKAHGNEKPGIPG